MFRIRTIIVIIAIAVVVYSLSPAHRKQRIKGKLREIWFATTLAIVLYWIFMLAAFAWKHWNGT
jgi:hypothetical protein